MIGALDRARAERTASEQATRRSVRIRIGAAGSTPEAIAAELRRELPEAGWTVAAVCTCLAALERAEEAHERDGTWFLGPAPAMGGAVESPGDKYPQVPHEAACSHAGQRVGSATPSGQAGGAAALCDTEAEPASVAHGEGGERLRLPDEDLGALNSPGPEVATSTPMENGRAPSDTLARDQRPETTMSIADAIRADLAQHPRSSAGEVHRRVGPVVDRNADQIAQHLSNLFASGRLDRDGERGAFRYSLPSPAPAPAREDGPLPPPAQEMDDLLADLVRIADDVNASPSGAATGDWDDPLSTAPGDGDDDHGPARRDRIDLARPPEASIRAAMAAVEAFGADVRLTRAADKLHDALGLVADFVDGVPARDPAPLVDVDDATDDLRAQLEEAREDLSRWHRLMAVWADALGFPEGQEVTEEQYVEATRALTAKAGVDAIALRTVAEQLGAASTDQRDAAILAAISGLRTERDAANRQAAEWGGDLSALRVRHDRELDAIDRELGLAGENQTRFEGDRALAVRELQTRIAKLEHRIAEDVDEYGPPKQPDPGRCPADHVDVYIGVEDTARVGTEPQIDLVAGESADDVAGYPTVVLVRVPRSRAPRVIDVRRGAA